jgi:hypothetical protein
VRGTNPPLDAVLCARGARLHPEAGAAAARTRKGSLTPRNHTNRPQKQVERDINERLALVEFKQ